MRVDEKNTGNIMMGEAVDGKHDKGEKHKKIMSMEDVADNLEEDFADEIADSKKYLCMAKVADKANMHHDHYCLLEMAKDEYTHARFIRSFMMEHNIDIPEEQDRDYHKLEEEIGRFFRA